MFQGLAKQGKKIILFDGGCNVCDRLVQILLKNDPNDVFRFVSLQSDTGKIIQDYYQIDARSIDSIVVIDPSKKVLIKSQALFSIINSVSLPWQLLGVFQFLPVVLGDYLYDHFAKNRYRLFGRKNTCMIVTDEIRHKFLEY